MAEKEGRPTVMTPEIIGKLEQAFLMGCSDKEACLFAEIHPSTLYDYQKLNPRFTERKELLKENPIFKARMKVVEDMERNVDSARWFLERKKKDEFSLRSELTGKDGSDLRINVIDYNGSNHPTQLPAEGLPVRVPEEPSEVQGSNLAS